MDFVAKAIIPGGHGFRPDRTNDMDTILIARGPRFKTIKGSNVNLPEYLADVNPVESIEKKIPGSFNAITKNTIVSDPHTPYFVGLIQNLDIYPMLCKVLGIVPNPNDGSDSLLQYVID